MLRPDELGRVRLHRAALLPLLLPLLPGADRRRRTPPLRWLALRRLAGWRLAARRALGRPRPLRWWRLPLRWLLLWWLLLWWLLWGRLLWWLRG
ncbi:hypothetical protein [Amycolatopsis cihanbeyliensis]|uniref:hypothetical protein n=1 Tax=Amycolatopsis cihanbeyliensis TaxID=1128664 RepID=UPI001FEAF120|nr:hypothetical protein [Amycolatopsis cihanbeyliensis]